MSGEDSNQNVPVVTVIAPVDSESPKRPQMPASLVRQLDQRWELIYVGRTENLPALENTDPRITAIASEGTSFAAHANAGLRRARGELVMIAPRDGSFETDAVRVVADLSNDTAADVLYSDEQVWRGKGSLPQYILKPAFSPERLRCQFYFGDPVFYRTAMVQDLGGLREQVPGAELYDLALRAAERASRVEHTDERLFTLPWAGEPPGRIHAPGGLASTRMALEEHLAATGGGQVDSVDESGIHRTHRLVVGSPLVSIIIPSRGSMGEVRGGERCMVVDAVRSVIDKSTYSNYELVVVMDEVATPEVVETLREIAGDRLRLVWWRHPFTFSGKVNFGAYHSKGEYLLFLNDDTEVISPGWIEALLALCQRPGAGMSGAMLYFEDGTVQHAGHIYTGGDAGHAGTDLPRGSDGPQGSLKVEREAPGVTAACSMMPASVFREAGGFSLRLPNNFNDVDLCLKVRQLGYRIYWTPRAELFHYESKTRQPLVSRYEIETAWGRWEWMLDDQTYWPYGTHKH